MTIKQLSIYTFIMFCMFFGGFYVGRLNTIPRPCLDEKINSYNLNCVLEIAEIIEKYDN